MDFQRDRFKLALALIPTVGAITARTLVAYCGEAEAIFKESRKNLLKIPGIGPTVVEQIRSSALAKRVDEEFIEMQRHKIDLSFFTDSNFPHRLQEIHDAPAILFSKGICNWNHTKILAIVGTRSPTRAGLDFCEKIIKELAASDVAIFSGLAYGIDIQAHASCIRNQIPTVAVLAHGLDLIYPSAHRKIALSMLDNGGLISEFPTKTKPDRERFPMRNRIIASISDATLVIESSRKGGSMITAELANGYGRDVFAIPGRPGMKMSAGCNLLIKGHRAQLIESAGDLKRFMNWGNSSEKPAPVQVSLEIDDGDEKRIVKLLEIEGKMHGDKICRLLSIPPHQLRPRLLNLEFAGFIKSLPGNQFSLL